MLISVDCDDVQLLIAVEQGRVHCDPRFNAPDFEKLPDPPFGTKRATQRLKPLKRMELVVLADEAGQDGIRQYQLTGRGEEILAAYREQEAAALADTAAAAQSDGT